MMFPLARLSGRLCRTALALSIAASAFAVSALSARPAAAQMRFVAAQNPATLLGPELAQGAVIWSHGRSVDAEDSEAPTPDYVGDLQQAGWDTFRLNRPRIVDTLEASGAALAQLAEALKRQKYRRVVLAGQSFGAFTSLIAADQSPAVDAVIATAPAAYGSVESNPAGYGLNATELYELLGAVRRARVALFFFAGDIFDPGGRGSEAARILSARGLPHLVIDRPTSFKTHWAAGTPLFAQHFGKCLAAFAAGDVSASVEDCHAPTETVQIAGLSHLTASAVPEKRGLGEAVHSADRSIATGSANTRR